MWSSTLPFIVPETLHPRGHAGQTSKISSTSINAPEVYRSCRTPGAAGSCGTEYPPSLSAEASDALTSTSLTSLALNWRRCSSSDSNCPQRSHQATPATPTALAASWSSWRSTGRLQIRMGLCHRRLAWYACHGDAEAGGLPRVKADGQANPGQLPTSLTTLESWVVLTSDSFATESLS